MIKVEETLQLNIAYDLEKIGKLETLLFFDIETTGLSAHNSQLYMIGCIFFVDKKPHFIQWMAESLADELPMLQTFFEFCKRFDTLISFNGATFDTNYLEICAHQYGVRSPLGMLQQFDILKEVRPLKNLLNLDNCKQKSIESFLGIKREDQFSGGELIPIYEEFVEKKYERLKHFLLLHNREDLIGMTQILPIIHYIDFFKGHEDSSEMRIEEAFFRKSGQYLDVKVRTSADFITPLHFTTEEGVMIFLSGHEVTFQIPAFCGELKYFYPNFRDYYYLPFEDTAIHKKVAQFVDKNHRVQATKETCYQKISGQFLVATKRFSAPVFKSSPDDKTGFVQFEESSLASYLKTVI